MKGKKAEDNLYQMSKYDGFLITIVLIIAMVSLFSFKQSASAGGEKVLIYENSSLLKEIDLNREKTFEVNTEKGKMEIEIGEGRTRVLKSSCPQKICLNTGWISKPGQTVVCIPNRILLEVKGGSSEYHAISY